ncbi:nuclear transport factor 2 family protein [Mycobacterium sp. 2YAF39]|uniref:nuclear transport factor 2 family protein n=1 Tax=Mycobacterium sp. 2YAF39 TaxID=3233033 RepID=UPI003F9B7E50
MAFTRSDVLATAERSPAAAGARDKAGWVGLFTEDGRVEDPVGSQPHRGVGAIGRFYDTFIAPRHITYRPDADVVTGCTVVRDGELDITMGPIDLSVPVYIRYDMQERDGALKIAALSAFWELPAMAGQFLRGGVGGLPAGLALSRSLLVNQGFVGVLGYLGGVRGTGAQGKRKFGQFLDDAHAGDEVAVRRWLGKGARVTSGDDVALSTAELLSRIATARPRKMIASGYNVVVGLDRDGRRDVLIAEVSAKPFAIRRIRYFEESAEDTAEG